MNNGHGSMTTMRRDEDGGLTPLRGAEDGGRRLGTTAVTHWTPMARDQVAAANLRPGSRR